MLYEGKLHPAVVGEAEISFRDICKDICKEKWIELDGENSKIKGGMVCMKFDIKGPSASLCPKCNLVIGSLPTSIYKGVKYHSRCVTCSICSKKLDITDFREKNMEFYCRKDFIKKFAEEEEEPTTLTHHSPSFYHNWSDNQFRNNIACCATCGGTIPLGTNGYSCTECLYPCHKECKDLTSLQCSNDPKSTQNSYYTSTVSDKFISMTKVVGRHTVKPLSQMIKDRRKLDEELSSPEPCSIDSSSGYSPSFEDDTDNSPLSRPFIKRNKSEVTRRAQLRSKRLSEGLRSTSLGNTRPSVNAATLPFKLS